MNKKFKVCSLHTVILAILVVFLTIFTYRNIIPHVPAKGELYAGQQTVLNLDKAHQYVRDNIAPSVFAVEVDVAFDVKVYEGQTETPVPKFHGQQQVGTIFGTASVITKDTGYLITAKHVVNKKEFSAIQDKFTAEVQQKYPGSLVVVQLITRSQIIDGNGKKYPFTKTILGDNELALIRVDDWKSFHVAPLVLSTDTNLSDKSVAIIGTPLGIKNVIMDGRIARPKFAQTEDGNFMYVIAPINPGNSGGPAVTTSDMKLVGVVSQVMINQDPVSLTSIGLLIPNTEIQKFLDKSLPKE